MLNLIKIYHQYQKYLKSAKKGGDKLTLNLTGSSNIIKNIKTTKSLSPTSPYMKTFPSLSPPLSASSTKSQSPTSDFDSQPSSLVLNGLTNKGTTKPPVENVTVTHYSEKRGTMEKISVPSLNIFSAEFKTDNSIKTSTNPFLNMSPTSSTNTSSTNPFRTTSCENVENVNNINSNASHQVAYETDASSAGNDSTVDDITESTSSKIMVTNNTNINDNCIKNKNLNVIINNSSNNTSNNNRNNNDYANNDINGDKSDKNHNTNNINHNKNNNPFTIDERDNAKEEIFANESTNIGEDAVKVVNNMTKINANNGNNIDVVNKQKKKVTYSHYLVDIRT